MQRFLGSFIFIRKNRFKETGSKFEPVSIESITIGKSLNSINLEKEFFTNYVNTPNQKVYKIIEEFYKKYINNIDTIFKDYISDDLYDNGKPINRLITLINETNGSNYSRKDLPSIYKLKNIKEPKIHLYIKIINKSIVILLIDLYHLSIPADIYLNHQLTKKITLKDLSILYNKYKNYNYNLNHIIRSEELVTQ